MKKIIKIEKRHLKKICVVIMILSLIGTVGNVGLIVNNISANTNNKVAKVDKTINELIVVKELKDKRTENSNTYLMSDGSKKIEIYSGAIRYKENGRLVDYNPSLIELSKEDRNKLSRMKDIDVNK